MSRQARRARQEPDAQRFEREIRVFPALAHAYTKIIKRNDVDAGVRRVCGIYGEERNKSHSLAAGTRSGPALPASGRFERLFEQQKDFQVWRGKAGSIDNIGKADTLPTEGFYD